MGAVSRLPQLGWSDQGACGDDDGIQAGRVGRVDARRRRLHPGRPLRQPNLLLVVVGAQRYGTEMGIGMPSVTINLCMKYMNDFSVV